MKICPIKYRKKTAFIFLIVGLLLCGPNASAGSVSYAYDSLGRVKQVVYIDGSKTTTIDYSYDAAGNRTSVVTTKSP
ncbi:RHS Repeat protein [compost metagenome]